MAQRKLLPRYSPREWAVRGTLAALAAVVGCFSVAHTLAQVTVKDDPAFAHRLAPWDGRITAALAASLAGLEATPADRARAETLARRALLRDPTAVAAVSTLGINAQLRGDEEGARRLFVYSQKLSRRDFQTQLWVIEDAVARGDIAGALKHYDIALRTHPESWDLLFPVLVAASGNPGVRTELVLTLAGKPLWSESFVQHVAANGPDPKSTAALLLGLHRARVAVPESAHASVINTLIGGGFADDAWRHYAAIRRGVDRRRSRDPRFAEKIEAPTVFDWIAINDVGVNASIQPGENGGGVFDFAASASTGGPLLQQVQMLPPGSYRIEGQSSGIDQAPGAQPYWLLACRTDGRELGRVVVPNSAEGGGNFVGELKVPAGCPVQVLVLFARASQAVSGLSGQIGRVSLGPTR